MKKSIFIEPTVACLLGILQIVEDIDGFQSLENIRIDSYWRDPISDRSHRVCVYNGLLICTGDWLTINNRNEIKLIKNKQLISFIIKQNPNLVLAAVPELSDK